MEEHIFLPDCNDNDVITFEGNNLNKLGKFKQAIIAILENDIENNLYNSLSSKGFTVPKDVYLGKRINNRPISYYNKWLEEGVHCELLRLGSDDWQKGKIKIRVSVEFCPDEAEVQQPESPLDDIRQAIAESKFN